MDPRSSRSRDLLIVLGFTAAASLPLLFEPYHMDEPFFLSIARHILQAPLHPLDYLYANDGRLLPMSQVCNTPLLFCYVLAGVLRVSGGLEWLTRALLLPFDLGAAAALYLIARRFLRRPLWPALICLAAPAWLINIGHVMGEKPLAAFSLWSLHALIRGVDDRDRRWYWASAALCACAMLCKYAGVFLLAPAVGYAISRGIPARRITAWSALASLPVVFSLLWDRAAGGSTAGLVWRETVGASSLALPMCAHKLRALFSVAGGCGLVAALWPLLVFPPKRSLLAIAAALAGLFMPGLDITPAMGPVDRLTGFFLSLGAFWGIWNLLADRRGKSWALWSTWFSGVALLLAFVYWSVLARLEVFLLPPLVFAMAERLETDWPAARLERLYRASAALCLLASAALGLVDFRFALAQKNIARKVAEDYAAHGRRVWHAAHWGLSYYLERAGATSIDLDKDGWGALKSGDAAVVARLSSDASRPPRMLANVTTITVGEPLPLRLIGGWKSQAGFYSSFFGFLPFSFSREPLEEFTIVEPLSPSKLATKGRKPPAAGAAIGGPERTYPPRGG